MFTVRVAIVMKQNEFDAKVASEKFPRANRAGLEAVCRWYVTTVIPRHFKGNNRWVYQHAPRKPQYLKRKRAVITRAIKDIEGRNPEPGDVIDLVYTGNLRREALASTWTADTERGRVNVRGRVLNIGQPPYSQVNMRAEMMYMPPKELEEVEMTFTKAFEASWGGTQTPSKTGIRTGRQAKPTPYL